MRITVVLHGHARRMRFSVLLTACDDKICSPGSRRKSLTYPEKKFELFGVKGMLRRYVSFNNFISFAQQPTTKYQRMTRYGE